MKQLGMPNLIFGKGTGDAFGTILAWMVPELKLNRLFRICATEKFRLSPFRHGLMHGAYDDALLICGDHKNARRAAANVAGPSGLRLSDLQS